MFIASRRVLLVNLQGQRHRYTHDIFPDLALAFLHFPWQMQVRVKSSIFPFLSMLCRLGFWPCVRRRSLALSLADESVVD